MGIALNLYTNLRINIFTINMVYLSIYLSLLWFLTLAFCGF